MTLLALLTGGLAVAQSAPELAERHQKWLEEEVPYITTITGRGRDAFRELSA